MNKPSFCFAFALVLSVAVSARAELLRHNQQRLLSEKIRDKLDALPSLTPMPAPPVTMTTLPPLPPSVTAAVPAPLIAAPMRTVAKPAPTEVQLPLVQVVPEPNAMALKAAGAQVSQPATLLAPTVADLSPKTKNLLYEVGAGLGANTGTPENIVIKKGLFEEKKKPKKGKKGEDVATGGFVEVEKDKEQPSFEIEMSSTKAPSQSDYEMLMQANKAFKVGQYESAITLYKRVLQYSPKYRDAMLGLASSYHKSGQKNAAKQEYENLLRKHPRFEPALNNLLLLAAQEAPEKALLEFSRIEARNPLFAAVYARKAQIYRDMNSYELAKKNLSRALQLEPENQQYRYDLAVLEDENQNYSAATTLYLELMQAANNNIEIPVDGAEISERMSYISTLK